MLTTTDTIKSPSIQLDTTVYPVSNFDDLVYPAKISVYFSNLDSITIEQLNAIKHIIELPPTKLDSTVPYFDSTDENIVEHLKSIDFSGDGIPDLVYCDCIHQEGCSTILWIKTDSLYKYCSIFQGQITKLHKGQ